MDNDKPQSNLKFVPSISHLRECAKKLPEAHGFKSQTLDVPVEGKSGVCITFERIKYVGKSGVSEARWSYKGRMLVGEK